MLDAFAWSYDNSELSPLISTIEYYTSVPILIIAFIVYILVLYVLIAQVRYIYEQYPLKIQIPTSPSSTPHISDIHGRGVTLNERRILRDSTKRLVEPRKKDVTLETGVL